MNHYRSLIIYFFMLGLFVSNTAFAQPYDMSPAHEMVLSEVIWASATGGGTWMTEIQITDMSPGGFAAVQAYVYLEGESSRGPFDIWTNNSGPHRSFKNTNLLELIQNVAPGPDDYYGRVGSVHFVTQDSSHVIHVAARTYHSYNYSKCMNALDPSRPGNTAKAFTEYRDMMILNLVKNSDYRSACGFVNVSDYQIMVSFTLKDNQNNTIGSSFNKTIGGRSFISFNPFSEAGISSGTYENCKLYIDPVSGTGTLMCFGATANNNTNDPAIHIAVPVDY
jgi:hypothetical protein